MEGIDKLICRKEMMIFTANKVSLAAPAALIQTENNQTENKQRIYREQTGNSVSALHHTIHHTMQRVVSIYHICGGVSSGHADFYRCQQKREESTPTRESHETIFRFQHMGCICWRRGRTQQCNVSINRR
jgi:hypothetical protein